MINKATQEALFGLHVDCFLEGLMEEPPAPADFGLTEEEAKPVRDQVVRGAMERTDWEAGVESLFAKVG